MVAQSFRVGVRQGLPPLGWVQCRPALGPHVAMAEGLAAYGGGSCEDLIVYPTGIDGEF